MAHGGTELTEFISKPHAPQRCRRHKERRRFPIQEANIFIVISFNKHCSYTPLLSAASVPPWATFLFKNLRKLRVSV